MASLEDYGIRIISHGEWSDPEIRWVKSDYQTLLFNYWDVAECTDLQTMDLTDERDLEVLVAELSNLSPWDYEFPHIYYEWEVIDPRTLVSYDSHEYFDDYRLYEKRKDEDVVLRNTSQALSQALSYLDDKDKMNMEIEIYRTDYTERELVAYYLLQGSTLKDCMYYGKK